METLIWICRLIFILYFLELAHKSHIMKATMFLNPYIGPLSPLSWWFHVRNSECTSDEVRVLILSSVSLWTSYPIHNYLWMMFVNFPLVAWDSSERVESIAQIHLHRCKTKWKLRFYSQKNNFYLIMRHSALVFIAHGQYIPGWINELGLEPVLC